MKYYKFQLSYLILIFLAYSCSDQHEERQKHEENKRSSSNTEKFENTLFKKISPQHSNINFSNELHETTELNIINYHYFYNGGGVAAGDFNNDGLIDLYFTANQKEDKLYLNKGKLVFEDVSDRLPQKDSAAWSTGVLIADFNQDGLLDIYLSQSGRVKAELRKNRLLINNGDLKFTEEAEAYGLDDEAYSTQAAVLDFDRDGDLDLFLLNHEIDDIFDFNKTVRSTQKSSLVGDKLFRNDGGKFIDVSEAANIDQNPYGFGLGVAISDFNNDGWPDIYVSNDFSENDFMYINQKNGSFKNVIKAATKHNSNYGMGVDAADINNDALSDLLVVDMVAKDNYRQKTNMSGMNPDQFWKTIAFGFHYQYMYNTLHLNQGEENFSDVAKLIGVSNTDWSWSPLIVDFDLDGNKDIFISNGLRKDVRNNDFVKKHILYAEQMPKNKNKDSLEILRDQLWNMPSNKIANYAFQNKGSLNFKESTKAWGLNHKAFSTGAIYADLDNDGDQDLIINNVDDTAFVYENTTNKKHLTLLLKGPDKNKTAIGSKLILSDGNHQQMLEYYPSRGFQSSTLSPLTFGIADSIQEVTVKVIWPNGQESSSAINDFNKVKELDFRQASLTTYSPPQSKKLVRKISKKHGINYNHYENYFDDYKDQVLLPHQLSNLGPALAVADVNKDGLEDFFIGSAVGHYPALYLQAENGTFKRQNKQAFELQDQFEEMAAVFFDANGDGNIDLYIGNGSYEFKRNAEELQDRLYLNDGQGNFSLSTALPLLRNSTSTVVPFDFDGDGDLDLFVGSRMQQKRYPLPPPSYLLENQEGKFVDVSSNKASMLKDIGMVTAAVAVDKDMDGDQDLILTGEWMPLVILENNNSVFNRINSASAGLNKSGGWWYSLAVDDLDQDGDLDIVAGNLGKNYKYKASEEKPFKVFSNDFDGNQTVDIILSYEEEGTYYPLRGRQCSSEQLPILEKKFPDYNSFASASVLEVIGREDAENAYQRNAYNFSNGIFMNENSSFSFIPFDNYHQISSINSILLKDLNNDGYKDLIMGGNLYSSEVETPRNDASYGHILINQKDGTFKGVESAATAAFGEGEIKAIRAIKVKGVGDAFLVAQNNGFLQLYTYN